MLLVKSVLKIQAKTYYFITKGAKVKQRGRFDLTVFTFEKQNVSWNKKEMRLIRLR